MGRRFFPPLLVAVAAIADSAGDHGLARDALLVALPFAAVAALVRVRRLPRLARAVLRDPGALLRRDRRAAGALVRRPSSAVHGVPPLAVSSLVAVVGLFALKGLPRAAPHWRRLGSFSPAKP